MGFFGPDIGGPSIASPTSQSSSATTDNSTSATAASNVGGSQIGADLKVANSTGNTFNVSDPVATLAAKDLGIASVQGIQGVAGSVVDQATQAIKGAFTLADKSRQTDTQTVFSSLVKIAGFGLGAIALFFVLYFLFKRNKSNAS